jgi:large subunit ribosomal protein L23Ae
VKAKKVVLKGVHIHKKKICMSPTFLWPDMMQLQRLLNYPQKIPPRRCKPHYVIITFPVTTKSVMKKTENTLCSLWMSSQQDVRNPYDTDVAKVNTLIRPAGWREGMFGS